MTTPALELFDSHVHLDSTEYAPDQEAVIERARAAGITSFISIGAADGFESASRAIALAERCPFIWASAGIHPHDAGLPLDILRIKELAMHPRVVAIGETGLDYYRDWAPVEGQRSWFRAQISLARELKKPLIIHSRNAGDECLATLIDEGASEVGGVFHCFAEDASFAKKLREINFLVSFPGTISFKKADNVRAAAREIPLDQILIETDGPYMAPEPHRGKRCESAFMVHTAQALASAKGITLAEVAAATVANTKRLFNL
jgi:TatD DNase family protein